MTRTKVRSAFAAATVIALTIVAPSAVVAGAATGGSRFVDGYRCSVVSHQPDRSLTGRPGQVVCGLGANDHLTAGGGTEVLIAGPGRDVLRASTSVTSVDVLIGGSGNDTLHGGAGTDTLIGGSGTNGLLAGSGTQFLYAGSHANLLRGGSGVDTLIGGRGKDLLIAGTGPTTLIGGSGFQILAGGSGRDVYVGGTGHTSIKAGTGTEDILAANSSKTALDCGSSTSSTVSVDRGDAVNDDCHGNGDHEGDYQFYAGTVTGVSGAEMTVTYSVTNDVAQAWLAANGAPTTVTFDLSGAKVRSDTGSVSPAVNDCADTLATTPTSGLVLPAVFVELHSCQSSDEGLQRYRGIVTSVAGSQMTVAWSDANDTAQAWLAANGNPTSVTFDISAATIKGHDGSSAPVANDCVAVSANTPSSGLILPAVVVHIHTCHEDEDGLLGFKGTVTGVTGSQVTVAYTDANDAAQAWLNANGNPASVTVDISAASVESDTGSTTPAVNDCIGVAANAPTSGLVLPAVYVELHHCDGDGHGHGGDHLQRYRGVVASVSGSQMTVTWSDANDAAQAWLSANGNPSTVTFDISAATIESDTGSSTPAANDCVGVAASTPTSGLVLPAVYVELHTCDGNDVAPQLYAGTVTGFAGSQMSVNYSDVNDAAQTWLDANGDPNPVAFDISSATIQSDTGSSTPATGDCVAVAASAPSSGVVLPAVEVWLVTCDDGGDGH
jgi:hypothetical protein